MGISEKLRKEIKERERGSIKKMILEIFKLVFINNHSSLIIGFMIIAI